MTKGMLSIIIPDRQEQFLQKTVDDLLAKAEGLVEVVICMDGIWNKDFNWNKENIVVIHHGTVQNSRGMRASINAGVAVAKGEYIMVLDAHCMMGQGYDRILKEDCEEHDVVIPRRYRLDPEKWEIIDDGRVPIDSMFIDFPYRVPDSKDCGLHGAEWKQRYHERKDILYDPTPSMQGSCYFMTRKYWDEVIDHLEDENYGPFAMEAQEVGFKTWFSGGRVMTNKRTWYAHLHKGKKFCRGYGFSNAQYREHGKGIEKGRIFSNKYWLNTKDYPHDWDWFMKKFPDMPGWEKDWKKQLSEAKKI